MSFDGLPMPVQCAQRRTVSAYVHVLLMYMMYARSLGTRSHLFMHDEAAVDRRDRPGLQAKRRSMSCLTSKLQDASD